MSKADPILVYLDESGDHSLEIIDKSFPIFLLNAILMRQSIYINKIVPEVYNLKFRYFGHEGVILHSRDIRRANRPFDFMMNQEMRLEFMASIANVLANSNFHIVAAAIMKKSLVAKYSNPFNPYELALKFLIERFYIILSKIGQSEVRLIAESRGENEDNALRLAFHEILHNGTGRIGKQQLAEIKFVLSFLPKYNNVIGTQIADLCGYPLARFALDPKKPNASYDIIKPKVVAKIDGWDCFKIFP